MRRARKRRVDGVGVDGVKEVKRRIDGVGVDAIEQPRSGEASKGVHGRGRRAVGRVAVVRRERPAPHEEGRAFATGHEAGERRVAACA